MINHTIDRLQKASTGAGHMGGRYARLLQLLWRKVPKATNSSLATATKSYVSQPRSNIQQLIHPSQPYPAQSPTVISPSLSFQQQQHHMQHFQPPPLIQQTSNHLSYHPSDLSNPAYQAYPQQHQNQNRTFSWLDLGATWNFATQNGSGTGSNSGSLGEMDVDEEHGMWDQGLGPLDIGLMTDYSVLEGDNPNLIF